MNNHNNSHNHDFTQPQVNSINHHLDGITDYLSRFYSKRDKEETLPSLTIRNPNQLSPLEYIYINSERIAIQYQDYILLELNRTPSYCEDTVYNYPEVGYELLLNWKELKDEVWREAKKRQTEISKVNAFLDGFSI